MGVLIKPFRVAYVSHTVQRLYNAASREDVTTMPRRVESVLRTVQRHVNNAISKAAGRNGIGAYGRMTSALVDMEKPQAVYQGFVTVLFRTLDRSHLCH